ncbi:MAG TPA: hypothetical protein VEQ67_09830, partial [Mycobacterium sp.]|nr:hypothetical protein [Mycobacterium sp.]
MLIQPPPVAKSVPVQPGGGRGRLATDVGVRRGNDHVRDPRHEHMERVDGDVSRPVTRLLVDDHFPIPKEQRHFLIGRTRD